MGGSMTHKEMIGRINAVRYGNNINAHERMALSEVAVALRKHDKSEPEPLEEGWAFLDDRVECPWVIAWLQDQSPSARYLILTERKS